MMKRVLSILVICGFLAVPALIQARTLTGGHGIPVVADPRDLSLVDLRPLTAYLYSDLKNKGVFGLVRRTALSYKAGQIGIPDARKKALHGGFVISRGPSGNLTTVLVLNGDLSYKEIRKSMEKDYREYMEVNRGNPQIVPMTIGGVEFERFSYAERPYDVCIAQMPAQKSFIIASIPREDQQVLEETVRVVKGEEPLSKDIPRSVEAQTSISLTRREMERMVRFNAPKSTIRKTFNDKMKSLAKKLGIPHTEDEQYSLDERIRGQFALSRNIDITYLWNLDNSNASAYEMKYVITMADAGSAERLGELITEQISRISGLAQTPADQEALAKVTVNSSGETVNVNFLLDSPEAQYQHVSLVLSQMLRYRSLFSYLDRHGQGAVN